MHSIYGWQRTTTAGRALSLMAFALVAVAFVVVPSAEASMPPPHLQEIKFINESGIEVRVLTLKVEQTTSSNSPVCAGYSVPPIGDLVCSTTSTDCPLPPEMNARRFILSAEATLPDGEVVRLTQAFEAPSSEHPKVGCEGFPECLAWQATTLDKREGFTTLEVTFTKNAAGTNLLAHFFGRHRVADDPLRHYSEDNIKFQ